MTEDLEGRVVRKVALRLMPLLCICYVAAFIDRVNVGFAKLEMLDALGLTQSEYAFGAGIFFVGYFIFEVPSNLLLVRYGARRWIARIMLLWGVVSACMALVEGPRSFQLLRFLLGAAEAGFFPGIIFYLTAWFPRVYRARAVSAFMMAAVFSFVIGSPLSGWLLDHPQFGLAGWQWLFVIEGIPSVLLGFVVLAQLPDGPADARWLAADERSWLTERLARERAEQDREHSLPLGKALRDPRILFFSWIYFLNVVGGYGLDFFAPTLLKRAFPDSSAFAVGAIAMIPPLVALPVMVMFGRRADATRDYAGHVALAAFASAIGLSALSLPLPPVLVVAAMTLCVTSRWSLIGPFWSLPTAILSGAAAAGGIAWINSLGNLGGQLGPVLLDAFASPGGSFSNGLRVVAALLLCCSLSALFIRTRRWARAEAVAVPEPADEPSSPAALTADAVRLPRP
ncbi:MAG TPA: MFS transporter [Polyangiaceae bacterium]|nr:MFS transporter [Polyangiaceae bacterium]